MAFPGDIKTRVVRFGGASSIEGGTDLVVQARTDASRSLIWKPSGYRMERMTYVTDSAPGAEVALTLPATNQSGWVDSTTMEEILVPDEDTHSHTYTTTINILFNGKAIRTYTYGPYVVPDGETAVDGDLIAEESPVLGIAVPLTGGGGGAVSSVAGRMGDIVLTPTDIGLGNVDNTPDEDKPVSTATQTALDAKAADNAVVKLTGTQTIAGAKTFSSPPVVPTPTADNHAARKKYVDDAISAISAATNVIVLRYSGSGYPALPGTAPAGAQLINAIGPVQPTSENITGGIPSWVGNGENQVPMAYDYNGDLA